MRRSWYRAGMRTVAILIALSCSAVAGCGKDEVLPVDGPRADAASPGADAATDAGATGCDGTNNYTGELIDFDSTDTAFLGVVDAQFSVRGDPDCTATTAPNGRFILRLPDTGGMTDIDAPGDYVDAVAAVSPQQFFNGGATFSYRNFTTTRAMALYDSLGQTFDTSKAHVLVNQSVDLETFSLAATHDAVVGSTDGSTWAAADNTRYILFTNVDVGSGMTTLTGTATGASDLPLEAGKLVFASRLFVLD